MNSEVKMLKVMIPMLTEEMEGGKRWRCSTTVMGVPGKRGRTVEEAQLLFRKSIREYSMSAFRSLSRQLEEDLFASGKSKEEVNGVL